MKFAIALKIVASPQHLNAKYSSVSHNVLSVTFYSSISSAVILPPFSTKTMNINQQLWRTRSIDTHTETEIKNIANKILGRHRFCKPKKKKVRNSSMNEYRFGNRRWMRKKEQKIGWKTFNSGTKARKIAKTQGYCEMPANATASNSHSNPTDQLTDQPTDQSLTWVFIQPRQSHNKDFSEIGNWRSGPTLWRTRAKTL